MTGYKDDRPGAICFDSHDGFVTMSIQLVCHDGLYYCPTNIFTLGPCPLMLPYDNCTHAQPPFLIPAIQRVANQAPSLILRRPPCMVPTAKARQLESEVWFLRLGSLGDSQLDALPQNVTGLPATFEYHPFWFVNFKEQAWIRKQAAQQSAVRTPDQR